MLSSSWALHSQPISPRRPCSPGPPTASPRVRRSFPLTAASSFHQSSAISLGRGMSFPLLGSGCTYISRFLPRLSSQEQRREGKQPPLVLCFVWPLCSSPSPPPVVPVAAPANDHLGPVRPSGPRYQVASKSRLLLCSVRVRELGTNPDRIFPTLTDAIQASLGETGAS